MKSKIFIIFITSILFINIFAGSKTPVSRALNFDDVIACKRLGSPQFSYDGKTIAFTVKTVDEEKNKSTTQIWTTAADGSGLKQFTFDKKSSHSPKWSPRENKLAFLSSRNGSTQIWTKNFDNDELKQITSHYSGVSGFVWAPNGKSIALVSRVYPDCMTMECTELRDKEQDSCQVKARVYEELMYRHWDEWWDHKRSHIFVLNLENNKLSDVTPGDFDAPAAALGYGYTFSIDSKTIYFTSNHDKVIATSTNNDIWSVAATGGEQKLVTTECPDRNFKGNDYNPQFSYGGKYLAFISYKRADFEADKQDLFLKNMETGAFINTTANFKYSVVSYQWAPREMTIFCRVDQEGHYRIYSLDVESKKFTPLVENGYNRSITVSPEGDQFAYLHQTFTRPFELFTYSIPEKTTEQLTNFNMDIFADIDINSAEEFWFEGAEGTKVHGFIIKPPHFDPQKKYPMVFMVHGGPQGAWHDGWHYRWNAELWAAQGYVMVLTNPRGSTGYGQKFTDEISKDWGGKVFQDLIAGQKYVLENYNFIDKDKIAAAGASFGGYMMNWMEGHMESFQYPFKTLVNHDGAFNLYSKYLSTEELWFPEWEFDGPYWENDEYYKKFSPHNYVNNFKTPMLIIHGEKDYRLDFAEGLMAFTALKRIGIDAKLVLFPDEGHWVQKPQNSRFWHKTIFQWLDKYIK